MRLIKYTLASAALSVLALLSACTTPQVRQAAAPATTTNYNVSKDSVLQFCASGVTQSGTDYNFTGSCGVIPPPAGRYVLGPVKYPRMTQSQTLDLTKWENMWGRSAYNAPPVARPYPGISGSTPIVNPTVGQYIALSFTVPAGFHSGQYKLPPEWSIMGVDLSISVNPGDFSAQPLNPLCVAPGPQRGNQPVLNFRTTAGYGCKLLNGGTYYLNIRRSQGVNSGFIGITYQGE